MKKILILLSCLMLSACAIKFNLTPQEKAAADAQIEQVLKQDKMNDAQAHIAVAQTCRDECYIVNAPVYRVLFKYLSEQSEKAYLAGREDERRGVPIYDTGRRP